MDGAIFVPESGYVSDPRLSAHDLQRAAEAKGAEFLFNAEVNEIRKKDGRVAGVTLKDGTRIDAPIVVNVAGPHSYVINRMAVGTSGNQYKNAPVVGVMMAELIEKVEAGQDHDKDPVQFHMKYTGRTFNVGFYSRLREINPDSSFSVIG